MADHLTEEEQIEALKSWWKEYWMSVVVPVVAIAVGYFGWNQWQDQKQAKAEAGSVQYDALLDIVEAQPGTELTPELRAEAQLLATSIVDGFSGSLYADHANLILAKLAVDGDDLTMAEGYLKRVVDEGANSAIKDLAKTRLARIKVAQADYDAAITLASGAESSSYKPLFAEIRGDALVAQGKAEAAKTAYQDAMDNLAVEDYSRRSVLQMKLDGVSILAGDFAVNEEEGTVEQEPGASVEPAAEVETAPEKS